MDMDGSTGVDNFGIRGGMSEDPFFDPWRATVRLFFALELWLLQTPPALGGRPLWRGFTEKWRFGMYQCRDFGAIMVGCSCGGVLSDRGALALER